MELPVTTSLVMTSSYDLSLETIFLFINLGSQQDSALIVAGLKIVWVISREREEKRDHCPGLLTVKGACEIRGRKISYLLYTSIFISIHSR